MSTNWPEPRPRRRRGRRDNGLDAASYVKVRLVDPRVGEHLLDVLREARVAAYLDPVVGNDPYRLVEKPTSPPFDHLYVDAQLRLHAQEVLESDDAASPIEDDSAAGADQRHADRIALDSDEVDARFAELIGHFADPVDIPERPFLHRTDEIPGALSAEHADEPSNTMYDAEPAGADPDDPRSVDSSDPDLTDVWRGPTSLGPPADDPLDHYEPPDPGPIRAPSRQAVVAILVLIAGAIVLFFPHALGFGSTTSVVLGVLGITGGVGMLLMRLKEDPPDDDDGAIV